MICYEHPLNERIRTLLRLEDLFKKEVIGYRSPQAILSDWMLPILAELGFKYDSSVVFNSMYKKNRLDIPGFPTYPFWIVMKDQADLPDGPDPGAY